VVAAGESFDGAWERLRRQVELAEGFWLGLVFVEQAEQARELRRRYAGVMKERSNLVHLLEPATPSALLQLTPKIVAAESLTPGGVWVEAAARDPAGSAEAHWSRAWGQLSLRLNENRDLIQRTLPGPLVLVAHRGAKRWIREAASDLWSIRAITLETAGDERRRERAHHRLLFAAGDDVSGASDVARAIAEGASETLEDTHVDLVDIAHAAPVLGAQARDEWLRSELARASMAMAVLSARVDERVRAFVLEGDGRGAERAHAAAAALQELGCDVELVPTRHPVVDIVRFQLLTLALADARGVESDRIRRDDERWERARAAYR
jgi:hypothetical protein